MVVSTAITDDILGNFLNTKLQRKAKKFNFEKSKFIVADLHYYTPDQNYDIIVFNEAHIFLAGGQKK